MTTVSMEGYRVLVVEDEMLIAMDVEAMLEAIGCVVVGPTGKLETALQLANGDLDAAVLDVTIRGGKVFPVADRLLARGIPFILASGYGDWALPEQLRDQPRLTKPFTSAELEHRLRSLCDEVALRKRAGG